MGRRANHAIGAKTARLKLKPRASAYYSEIASGFHLGYRRSGVGNAGTWSARKRRPDGTYATEVIGLADDLVQATGDAVLSYAQAVERARECFGLIGRKAVTVRDAVHAWAEAKNHDTDDHRTRLNNSSTARRLAAAFRGRTLRTITAREIERWRDSFLDGAEGEETRRKRRATANRALANLLAALNRSADANRLPASARPWAGVKKFSAADSFGGRMVVLAPPERRRLLEATDTDKFRDLLVALMHTGARYGEIRSAKVGDFYPAAGTLRLNGKTGPRTITLGTEAAAFFTRLIDGVNDFDRPLLRHPIHGGAWADDEQRPHMARAVKAAGVAPETTLYAIRHSVISDWISTGVPIRAVAEQTGTSVAMIEATYAKFQPDQRRAWFATSV